MQFRTFAFEDALFCYTVRKRAFTELFADELTPAEIAGCVDAYALYDYVRMQKAGEFGCHGDRSSGKDNFTVQ